MVQEMFTGGYQLRIGGAYWNRAALRCCVGSPEMTLAFVGTYEACRSWLKDRGEEVIA